MSQLNVELVAADRRVWAGTARMVSARSSDGDLGILPGHQPILTILVAGEVTIKGEEGTQTATIDGGFMSVDHDTVRIIAEHVDVTAGSGS